MHSVRECARFYGNTGPRAAAAHVHAHDHHINRSCVRIVGWLGWPLCVVATIATVLLMVLLLLLLLFRSDIGHDHDDDDDGDVRRNDFVMATNTAQKRFSLPLRTFGHAPNLIQREHTTSSSMLAPPPSTQLHRPPIHNGKKVVYRLCVFVVNARACSDRLNWKT